MISRWLDAADAWVETERFQDAKVIVWTVVIVGAALWVWWDWWNRGGGNGASV